MAETTVRVRLRYPDLETFLERFASNVTRGGLFLPTRETCDVGALIRFELALLDGKVMVAGQGKVVWTRAYDAKDPSRPYGLGLQFTQVEPSTRPILERLIDRRAAHNRRATLSVPTFGAVAPPPTASLGGAGSAPTALAPEGARALDPGAAAEFDKVEDASVRRVLDRARLLSTRTDDLEALLRPETDEGTTVAQALAQLPKYLSGTGRRMTGGNAPLPAERFETPSSPSTPPPDAESAPPRDSSSGGSSPPTADSETERPEPGAPSETGSTTR